MSMAMDEQELLYTLALTRTLPRQSKHQRTLLQELGSAQAVYDSRRDLGRLLRDASERMAEAVAGMDSLLSRCEEELAYARDHHIRILAVQDHEAYPRRLQQCEDAPLILFSLGNADLNAPHIVSIVGTRRCSERGRDLCEQLTQGLAAAVPDALVVSGLAYGIDVAAHRGALNHRLSTVGVLAHGLDEIYPRTHRSIAVEMLRSGGLLTEFMSHTPIDRLNFLQRNRIVAGLADAVVVVESPARGGSLNTARLASDYRREVFAFPGRPSDSVSEGCNLLIRRNAATLLTSVTDLLADMGWQSAATPDTAQQFTLFPEFTADEQIVVSALQTATDDPTLITLSTTLNRSPHELMSLLIALEMKGLVKALPGSRYHLIQ